jgi:hypothetical protein
MRPGPRLSSVPTLSRGGGGGGGGPSLLGDAWLFGLFVASMISFALSLMIFLAAYFAQQNGAGFAADDSAAGDALFAYYLALSGSGVSVLVTCLLALLFGYHARKNHGAGAEHRTKVGPHGAVGGSSINDGALWGDRRRPASDAGSLGGQAHNLVRLLTSIETADPVILSTTGECVRILRSLRINAGQDRRDSVAGRLRKADAVEAQTGEWLKGILSATPLWLDNEDSDSETEADDGYSTVEAAGNLEAGTPSPRRRRKSSFQGVLAKIMALKAIGFETMDKDLITMMENIFEWKFDMFAFHTCSGKNSLLFITLEACRRLKLKPEIRPHSHAFGLFLADVQKGYLNNPYHNSVHAADVVQTCATFMQKPIMRYALRPLDQLALLVAAAIHDCEWGGFAGAEAGGGGGRFFPSCWDGPGELTIWVLFVWD